jgi:hypothetical protein
MQMCPQSATLIAAEPMPFGDRPYTDADAGSCGIDHPSEGRSAGIVAALAANCGVWRE